MGDSREAPQNHRQKACETFSFRFSGEPSTEVPQEPEGALDELRSNKVGVLMRIIDDLDKIGLSIREIETVIGTCGLNDDCAIRLGTELKEKKQQY